MTAATAALLVVFLVFDNGGRELSTGAPTGYWGMLVVPLAPALVPVAVGSALVALGLTGGGPAAS